jgi:hypothetical protein
LHGPIAPFKVKPASDPAEVGFPIEMPDMERSYVIGSYEYRLTGLNTRNEGQRTVWTAEITIIDTMGWDGVKYPIFYNWASWILRAALFGQPGREFSRGQFTVAGDVDCCKQQ